MIRLERFLPVQIAAVMLAGIAGVLIAGVQPQLLGALAQEGRVSVAALGQLATVELLAMGVAATVAGFVLPVTQIRKVVAVALATTAGANLVSAGATPGALFAARAVAGLGEGVLVWITVGLIVRTAHPARWSAIYLMTQTLAQLLLAMLLTAAILPRAGAAGGFVALGVITIMISGVVMLLPRAYPALNDRTARPARLSVRGLLALLGVVCYLAFSVSVWVYVEPLAHQRGVPAGLTAWIAPLSLVMQVIGAGCASLLSGRLAALPTLATAGVANLLLLGAMATVASPQLFVAATALFGFLWLFALPFQMPLVIAADPTRGAAALVGGAQLVGAATGPFVAALFVRENDVGAVLWFGATALIAAIVAGAVSGRASAVAASAAR